MNKNALQEKFKANKKLVIGVAVALLIVLLASVLRGKPEAGKEAPEAAGRPALAVRTATLREDKWARTLTATGSIVPWQEALINAQVQGLRIAEVKVSIGDYVKQGQVLVTLDNLAGGGGAQGRIVAPDDGVISYANANVGSMPQSGQELFRLIRQGRLDWRADLTAEELMLLKKGMSAVITVGEGKVIKGVVRAVSPAVDAKTRYGYALITLPDSTGIIAGAFARGTIDISGGKRTLQSLPQSAVMQRGSESFVLIVGDDNRVHERAVSTGQRMNDRIELIKGLKPGESVVESGGAFLTDGDLVLVVKG